jgi:hypothetical protein
MPNSFLVGYLCAFMVLGRSALSACGNRNAREISLPMLPHHPWGETLDDEKGKAKRNLAMTCLSSLESQS